MSFRVTFIFLAILVAIGGYTFLLSGGEEEKDPIAPRPRFYEIEPSAINQVTITYYGDRQVFVRAKPGDWRFNSVDGDPVSDRFTGTNLLASGGLSARVFEDPSTPEQLQEYGLEDPSFQMEVGVETGETYCVLLGNTTPDGDYNYSQVGNSPCEGDPVAIDPHVYLMPQVWGEVLAEFVTNPPIPPTPTPPPPAPTPQDGSA